METHNNNKKYTDSEMKEIQLLLTLGKTDKEIGKQVNRSEFAIKGLRQRHDLKKEQIFKDIQSLIFQVEFMMLIPDHVKPTVKDLLRQAYLKGKMYNIELEIKKIEHELFYN